MLHYIRSTIQDIQYRRHRQLLCDSSGQAVARKILRMDGSERAQCRTYVLNNRTDCRIQKWRRVAQTDGKVYRRQRRVCHIILPGEHSFNPTSQTAGFVSDMAGLQRFIEEAGLALNDGEMFSPGGEGFMRLNIGTSRETLRQAMERLRDAAKRLEDDL